MNAGSSYHRGSGSSSSGDSSVTVVGDDEDEIGGFGANAALNPNNEFRAVVADLGVSGSSGSQNSGYSGGHSQNGGGRAYQSGSSYSRSGSNNGASYSYSSSSGSAQSGTFYCMKKISCILFLLL